MNSPGLNLRPVRAMNDTHMFNEMFFDDVKVPKENMVGERGRGWLAAMALVGYCYTLVQIRNQEYLRRYYGDHRAA